jgi:hypothetical protein
MKITKYDLIMISFFLSISFVFLFIQIFSKSENNLSKKYVCVYCNGKLKDKLCIEKNISKRYLLDKNEYNEIQILDGKIKVIDSSCKNKICVKSGWIYNENMSIVCVPNKFIVKIEDDDNDNVDTITY